MNIGVIGLGGDGLNLAFNLKQSGYDIIVYDDDATMLEEAATKGFKTSSFIDDLAFSLESKRIIWISSPREGRTDEILEKLMPHLSVSDILISVNPTDYENTLRRCREAQGFQIDLLDCCFQTQPLNTTDMYAHIGGNRFAFNFCEKMFRDIAHVGHQYCGLCGSGIRSSIGTA
jgi:6-phosphogluconate dehydrogenase